MEKFRARFTRIEFIAVVVVLCVGGLFLFVGAKTNTGAPALPLDDSYIHLQYAWQAAHGKFLQYNDGEPATTGATSLLYMLLLAAFFALGASREAMPWLIVWLGWGLLALSALGMAAIAKRLARQLETSETLAGASALSLFVGSGWMVWAFFSGMETGLLIALVVGVLWAQATERKKLLALFTSLAVLTRPEAVLLALAILLITVLRAKTWNGEQQQRTAWAASPLLAALVPYLISWVFTGSLAATGLMAKSWFTLMPFRLGFVSEAIFKTLLELWPLWLIAVLGLLRVEQRLLFVCALWIVGGVGATATLQTATWHHYRHQMPLYPAAVVLLCAALAWLAKKNSWLKYLPVALLVWNIYSLNEYARAYALDTATVVKQQMVLADWIWTNLPREARLATHDVGVIRFLGERATLDVVGLTSQGMAAANRNGPGSLYEALARVQPNYYVVYPHIAPPYFGLTYARDLLGETLFAVKLDSFSGTTSAGDTQSVSKPDWSTYTLASAPQQPNIGAQLKPLTLIDRLNVGDLVDEAGHSYIWQNKGDVLGFASDARRMKYRLGQVEVMDGGRMFNGGESFVLHTLLNQDLLLVARLHQMTDMVLRVQVNGLEAGEWRLPMVAGEWLESVFAIPSQLITSEQTRVVLTVQAAPSDARYMPFYYWAYQGTLAQATPASSSKAIFADVAKLLDYEFTRTSTLNLTLRWQALARERVNCRVFVHLIDPANDSLSGIVAQHDAPPYAGTSPFWVWRENEVQSETLVLTLPPDLRPGDYKLLVGIYNADTGERVSLGSGKDFGDKRFELGTITVK